MKKVMMLFVVCLSLGFNVLNAIANVLVTGGYSQQNNANQVMSVGKTQMQIGASDRAHANYTNARSGAGRSLSNTGSGGGEDFQWGASQQENSWKAATNFKEAMVHGMTADDCQGDNSDGIYRAQMNQNRDGYMAEPLVSQDQCHKNHATLLK